jgi:hypothetical protein
MTLEKSNDRVDQVGEQNRESKDHDDGSSDVHNGQNNCEEQDCQQYVRGAAIEESHSCLHAAEAIWFGTPVSA